MLQELKVEKFRLDLTLQLLLPGYHSIVAYPSKGKGGVTLLIHPDFTIGNCSTIPDGSKAWAQLIGPLGNFHSTSIYGADSLTDCTEFWRTLQDTLPHGDWIIGGDFNFMESTEDSTT